MTIQVIPIVQIINDQNYAWALLEAQIQIQTSRELAGPQIANLLALYMKGVQKTNSVQDKREEFFQQKVTSLMVHPSVLRFLTDSRQPDSNVKPTVSCISEGLLKRKQEIEMHLQYQTMEHTEAMNRVIMQHNIKINTVEQKINESMAYSGNRIEERIRQRKARALTCKAKSIRDDSEPVVTFHQYEKHVVEEEQEPKTNKKPRKVSTSMEECETESPKRRKTLHDRQDFL